VRLPNIQKILRQDVSEAPDWILKIIAPINSFFEEIYAGLNRNITFSENIACTITEVQITTSSTYPTSFPAVTLSSKLKTIVSGVMLLKLTLKADNITLIKTASTIEWTPVEAGARIDFVSGLAASKTYTLRVMIL